MKYGEAVVMMQDSLPSWVFGAGDYLVAGFLLLPAIVLFSSLSALMWYAIFPTDVGAEAGGSPSRQWRRV